MKKVSTPTQTHTTLYSRDAQGNVLATYDFIPKPAIDAPGLDKPNEMMIYGSSRLGVKKPLQQRANSITNHATKSLSVSSGFFPKPFAEVQAEVCGNSGTETYVEPALDHTDVNYFRKHINESSTYLVTTEFGNPNPLFNIPMASYLYPEFTCSKNLTHTRLFTGMSEYELTNHLGNVLATVKDEPILTPEASLSPSNEVAFTKKPLILTAQDYYPFGMLMPNRSFSLAGSGCRFGFGGHEKDDEVYGVGNHLSFVDFGYDTRLGRRLRTDPHMSKYPNVSPYAGYNNNPILFIDVSGKDVFYYGKYANDAVSELKKTTSLDIKMEQNKVSLYTEPAMPMMQSDQLLYDAISDPQVNVNVYTTDGNWHKSTDGSNKVIIIGSYDGSSKGNYFETNPKVQTTQYINFEHSATIEDKGYSTMSKDILHETMESYISGKEKPGENSKASYKYSHDKTESVLNDDMGLSQYEDLNKSTGTREFGLYDSKNDKKIPLSSTEKLIEAKKETIKNE